MSNHYIRVDDQNNITKGFSDGFESPLDTDICIRENTERQFELNGEINVNLITARGISLYKYVDNTVIKKTDEEVKIEELSIVETLPKTKEELMQDQIDTLSLQILTMMGV